MNSQREKEIEALRNRLQKLEEEQTREKQQRETLEAAHAQLLETLASAEIGFDDYVRGHFREIRKVITRIEKAQAKAKPTAGKKASAKKRATTKKRRGTRRAAKVTVKIPAGSYKGIPAEPDRVFQVKEKGPRPKALRAYAEEIGLEAFMQQCRIADESA